MNDTERGIYHKYNVTKVEDGSEVTDCFVLRPDKDRYSRAALVAYADACHQDYPDLARDIRAWVLSLSEAYRDPRHYRD